MLQHKFWTDTHTVTVISEAPYNAQVFPHALEKKIIVENSLFDMF